jgi:hypothetical protein
MCSFTSQDRVAAAKAESARRAAITRDGWLIPVRLIWVMPTGWRLAVRRLVAHRLSQVLAPNLRCTVYLAREGPPWDSSR